MLNNGSDISLETRIMTSEQKIQEWFRHWNGKVYISFSGGKDSTVLLHLVRSLYPNVPAVFCDTGLEFPEIKSFVKSIDNVTILKPVMRFDEVITKYGFPLISKEVSQKIQEIRDTGSEKLRHKRLYGDEKGNGKVPNKWKFLIDAPFNISNKCCSVMKKHPFELYERNTGNKSYVGVMAHESALRLQSWQLYGCNAFELNRPQSRPLMPWSDQDIWEYISVNKIKISDIYSMGYDRTGCMFCGFGLHLAKQNKFALMEKTHPNQYKYIMQTLGFEKILKYINSKGAAEQGELF